MTNTVQRIAEAIDRARALAPGVRVVVVGDCGGRTWVIDVCCSIVYLSAWLEPQQFPGALDAAVDALVRGRPRPHLQVVPPPGLVRRGRDAGRASGAAG